MSRLQALMMLWAGLLTVVVAALAWVTATPFWLMALGGVLVLAALLIPVKE